MLNIEGQERLFGLIGKECRRRVDALVIGGSAMLFYNFTKTATKDVDIVMLSEGDRKYLVGVLEKIGFKAEIRPKKEGEPYRLVLKDYVLDVFAGSVFRLKISKGMLGRVKEKVEFGNVTVSVISPEDIILSKSMTDRAGDREDAVRIIKEINVKWDIVLSECVWQSQNGDFRFCIYLYDFLDELVHNFGIKLPKDITEKIKKLYRDSLEAIESKKAYPPRQKKNE